MKLRTPPYTKQLNANPRVGIRIFAGSKSWDAVPEFADTKIPAAPLKNWLVLPPGERATEYQWPVEGWFTMVLPCGDFTESDRVELASALLRDGATAVSFADTGQFAGKLREDAPYWKNKKPAEATRPERA